MIFGIDRNNFMHKTCLLILNMNQVRVSVVAANGRRALAAACDALLRVLTIQNAILPPEA